MSYMNQISGIETSDGTTPGYYKFGNGWCHRTDLPDGEYVVKTYAGGDPRVDKSARVDNSTHVFKNGNFQVTWFDADGNATVDTIES